MNKFAPFVEWLWSKRDLPYTYRTSVLTEANRRDDATVPVPPLLPVEAENLFQLLAKKDLVFFQPGPDPSYLLNKVEGHKWRKFIRELKQPEWTRSWLFLKLYSIIWLIIAGLIGGFVGGYSGAWGKKLVDFPAPKAEQSRMAGAPSLGGVTGVTPDRK